MSYRNFTLPDLVTRLHLVLRGDRCLFGTVPTQQRGMMTVEFLAEHIPLARAIGTEKARSEFIIAPILLELRRLMDCSISIFSGINFDVDPQEGMSGVTDFIISRASGQLYLRPPVAVVVEARNKDSKSSIAHCGAAMVAAQCFNARNGAGMPVISGAILTGEVWQFLQLDGSTLNIDRETYHVRDIAKIMGILMAMVQHAPAAAPA